MRDIKFRAWDKQTKNWEKAVNYELVKLSAEYPDRYILMQFTGLKDENGKGIYEGQEILGKNPDLGAFKGIVEWDNNQSMYILKSTNAEVPLKHLDEIRIIGSLELLEEKA